MGSAVTPLRGDAARLRASERCCALFVARGTTALTVAEIADAIGVSTRSFHRYFPFKADSIGPVLDWTTSAFDRAVLDAPSDASVRAVLAAAFDAALGGGIAQRTSALFPLVFADPEMWSVFLRKVHDGERSLAPALADRLSVAPDSRDARIAAAAVASSTRLALEAMVTSGADARAAYLEAIDAFASGPVRLL